MSETKATGPAYAVQLSEADVLFASYLLSRHIWGNQIGEPGATALGMLAPAPFRFRNSADVPQRFVR
jgi:hypothetical protein